MYQPVLLLALVLAGMLAILAFSRASLSLKLVLLLGGIPMESLGASEADPAQKPLLVTLGGTTVDGACLVVLSACFALLLSSSGQLSMPRRFRPYLYFVGFLALSLLYSGSRLDGLRLVLKVTYPVLVFFVTVKTIKTQQEIDSALQYWIAGGLLATLIGAAVFLVRGFSGFMWGGDFRYSSGLLHASPFSMYMFALFGLCYGLWRAGRGGRFGALAVVFGVQALMSETRITWAAMAFGVLVIEGLMGKATRSLVRAAGTIVAIGTVFFYVMQHSIGLQHRLFGGELDPGSSFAEMVQNVNVTGRTVVWAATYQDYWSHNHWIGQGAGSSAPFLAGLFEQAGVPHNEYLRILHDIGVVGLALFLAGIIGLFRLLRSLLGKSITKQQRLFVKVALALLVGYSVIAISDNPLDYYFFFSQYVFFCIGLATVAIPSENRLPVPQGNR
jgi:O-antigen ligase